MKKLAIVATLAFGLIGTALAAPPIEAYGQLPSVAQVELSPSGERYAFITVQGDDRVVGIATAAGQPLGVVKLGPAKVRSIRFAGENHLLIKTSATFDHPLDFVHAYEMTSCLNYDIEHKSLAVIFEKIPGVVDNVEFGDFGGSVANDHRYEYFVGMALNWSKAAGSANTGGYVFERDERNLYRVDLETAETTKIAKGGIGNSVRWVVAPDGNVLAHSEHIQTTGVWSLYRGADTGKPLLEKKAELGEMRLAGQGRTPGTVLLLDDSSAPVATELSLADGKTQVLFDGVTPIEPIYDADSGLLIGATIAQSPYALFFDPLQQARYVGARKAFPGYVVDVQSFSHNLGRLIVRTSGSDDPGTYWLVDIGTGQASPIGAVRPQIHAADIGPSHFVQYHAADGTPIEAVLTLPPGRKGEHLPLVVIAHEGPLDVKIGLAFDWWAQALASAGYAVLQPNFRGSAGYGADFEKSGYGEWGHKMQTDLSDGVAQLASEGTIDPKRVCIAGTGYGGYAALAGAALQPGVYRCAVSVGGYTDLPRYLQWLQKGDISDNDRRRYFLALTGGDNNGVAAIGAVSPINFVAKIVSPVLLIHGSDDTEVPIKQSQIMNDALKEAGKSVQFITLQGEDQDLSHSATRIAMLKATLDFIKQNNPPG